MVATPAETHGPGLSRRVAAEAPILAGLLAILAAFLVGFWPTFAWLASEWSGGAGVMSHGFLVAAISIFLIWRAIDAFSVAERAPAWMVLPALLGLSFIWLLGKVATVVAVQTLVLPLILLAALATAFGPKATRPFVFAIMYFYFAVPAWEYLQFVFQAITVWVVDAALALTGILAHVDGNFVHVPSGTFEIADGCSGLNFILAGLSLAVLYGHLYYRSPGRFLLLTSVMLLAAMIGNWVRVFSIVLIGYNTEMQSSLVSDHLTFGWILFAVLMIPVFFVARRLEDSDGDDDASASRSASPTTDKNQLTAALGLAAAILAMIVGPVWAGAVSTSSADARSVDLQLPTADGQWIGPTSARWDWTPEFAGPDAERLAEYRSVDGFVLSYSNVYLSQQQDRELIYYSNSVSGNWRRVADLDSRTANAAGFEQVAAENYAGSWLIWYRYQIADGFETGGTKAKIRQALSALTGRPVAGAIAFATLCEPDCDTATMLLSDFVADVGNGVRVTSTAGAQVE